MKTAVSLPDALFAEAEAVAKRLRMSRSKLYATALARFLKENGSRGVTELLNEVYSKEDSHLDPVLHALQLRSLPREKW
jgi:metal-responsive CopG/Arc/MetJ family transcriptional regulator